MSRTIAKLKTTTTAAWEQEKNVEFSNTSPPSQGIALEIEMFYLLKIFYLLTGFSEREEEKHGFVVSLMCAFTG